MSATPPLWQLPLTFGVEFEFVFAIHDSILTPSRNALRGGSHQWLAPVLNKVAFKPRSLPVLLEDPEDCPDYDWWILTYDFSARHNADRNLSEYFPDDTCLNARTLRQWDHDGMELMSRILEAPDLLTRGYPRSDPSMIEISQYLEALEEDQSALWFAHTTKDCGLHVHIGVPSHGSVDQIPLNVMRIWHMS
jgi:hypothetical protein